LLKQNCSLLLAHHFLCGSVQLTAKACLDVGASFLPFVLVLVNRSGFKQEGERTILALINRAMPMWLLQNCPLCAQKSTALKPPKDPAIWELLNAVY
jgi:hypothetical protein